MAMALFTTRRPANGEFISILLLWLGLGGRQVHPAVSLAVAAFFAAFTWVVVRGAA